MDGKSPVAAMPDITGKSVTNSESLYVISHTWRGGGRPVYVPSHVFVRALGYCVLWSYNELLVSAHCHPKHAAWASSIMAQFKRHLDAGADEVRISDEVHTGGYPSLSVLQN